jgi:hypothetical protein
VKKYKNTGRQAESKSRRKKKNVKSDENFFSQSSVKAQQKERKSGVSLNAIKSN